MRILIFNPYCQKNGAEVMINSMANEALDKGVIECFFYFPKKGNLLPDVNVPYFLSKLASSRLLRVVNILLIKFGKMSIQEREIRKIDNRLQPDYWYVNTVHLSHFAEIAHKIGRRVIIHYHDLLFQYERIPYHNLKSMCQNAFASIACSQVVADHLRIIEARNIRVQYECIPDRIMTPLRDNEAFIRDHLGIPRDRFVWAMSGNINMRKGVDYFMELAKRNPEDYFIWLGDGASGLKFFMEKKLAWESLDNVMFAGFQEDRYYSYLKAIDGFILTSREDPFPLVMIEVACLGKPILGFNSGGVKEFVQEEMGVVLEKFDLNQMDSALKGLKSGEIYFNATKIKKRGQSFLASKQYPKWEEMLQELEK